MAEHVSGELWKRNETEMKCESSGAGSDHATCNVPHPYLCPLTLLCLWLLPLLIGLWQATTARLRLCICRQCWRSQQMQQSLATTADSRLKAALSRSLSFYLSHSFVTWFASSENSLDHWKWSRAVRRTAADEGWEEETPQYREDRLSGGWSKKEAVSWQTRCKLINQLTAKNREKERERGREIQTEPAKEIETEI